MVGLADDEILEGIGGIEVEGAVGGDDGAVLLLVLRVRSGVGIIVRVGIGVFCIGRVVFAIRFLCIRVRRLCSRTPCERQRIAAELGDKGLPAFAGRRGIRALSRGGPGELGGEGGIDDDLDIRRIADDLFDLRGEHGSVLFADDIRLHFVFCGKDGTPGIQIVEPEPFEPKLACGFRDELIRADRFEHDLPYGVQLLGVHIGHCILRFLYIILYYSDAFIIPQKAVFVKKIRCAAASSFALQLRMARQVRGCLGIQYRAARLRCTCGQVL